MVRTSIWLIALITLTTIVLDLMVWNMVYHEGVTLPASAVQFSQIGRFIRTMLLLGFVPAILRSRASGYWLLITAFILAIIADFFLILQGKLIVGIAFFAAMQTLLMVRHLNGFQRSSLKHSTLKLSLGLALIVWLLAMLLLKSGLESAGLLLPVACYGLLLVLSVWAAFAAMHLSRLPLHLTRLAFYALLFFLACDVTVGLGAIWEGQSRGMLIRSFTGAFYGPCLILLGLSGIKRKG